jgi:pentose-5-phosphate-3-epimerase
MSDPEYPNTLFPNAYFDRGYEFAASDMELDNEYRTIENLREKVKEIAISIWPEDTEESFNVIVFITSVIDGYKAHKFVQRSIDKIATKERYKKESFNSLNFQENKDKKD